MANGFRLNFLSLSLSVSCQSVRHIIASHLKRISDLALSVYGNARTFASTIEEKKI